jgi:parallel beta-helix repeat protein
VSQGVVVVAAAGNMLPPIDLGATPIYPACYNGVIAVSATSKNDIVASYSSFGSAVDVAAPGGGASASMGSFSLPTGPTSFCGGGGSGGFNPSADIDEGGIYSTIGGTRFTDGYGAMTGTSMSCPQVAGLAALCLSVGASAGDVDDIIKETADDLGDEGEDDYYGAGRINAYRAVAVACGDTPAKTSSATISPFDGEDGVGAGVILNWVADELATSHDVYFGTSSGAVTNATTASGEFKGNQGIDATSYDPSGTLSDGLYYWRIDEKNSNGSIKGDTWSLEVGNTPQTIIFVDVDATGNNDGASWTNAYNDLQDALAEVVYDQDIWVAEGTYKPTSGTTRSKTFKLISGVDVYGGFDPSIGDDTLEERDPVNNVTILSGDIDGDSVLDKQNSTKVVYARKITGATINGFTITMAYGNGGLVNDQSSLIVKNCVFKDNYAGVGGGMYNNKSLSTTTIEDCTFIDNEGENHGGGIYNEKSSPTINRCMFKGNTSKNGAGMENATSSSPTIKNCVFVGNTASKYGGGIYNVKSSPTITNCTITGNTSTLKGGGIANNGTTADPVIKNCILWDNTANATGNDGDEIYNNNDSCDPTLSYCDIEGGCSNTNHRYTCTDGGGNINSDPEFVNSGDPDGNDNVLRTTDDGLRLNSSESSPCIDKGDNIAMSDSTDIAGQTRKVDDSSTADGGSGSAPIVDMGAYEEQNL